MIRWQQLFHISFSQYDFWIFDMYFIYFFSISGILSTTRQPNTTALIGKQIMQRIWALKIKFTKNSIQNSLQFSYISIISCWKSGDRSFIRLILDFTSSRLCGDKTGLFQDPIDCRYFFDCNDFYAFRLRCSPGTFFNDITKQCDFPDTIPRCQKQMNSDL